MAVGCHKNWPDQVVHLLSCKNAPSILNAKLHTVSHRYMLSKCAKNGDREASSLPRQITSLPRFFFRRSLQYGPAGPSLQYTVQSVQHSHCRFVFCVLRSGFWVLVLVLVLVLGSGWVPASGCLGFGYSSLVRLSKY